MVCSITEFSFTSDIQNGILNLKVRISNRRVVCECCCRTASLLGVLRPSGSERSSGLCMSYPEFQDAQTLQMCSWRTRLFFRYLLQNKLVPETRKVVRVFVSFRTRREPFAFAVQIEHPCDMYFWTLNKIPFRRLHFTAPILEANR